MGIMHKALMERKMCIHGLQRKYPGLPDYVMDNMTVMKILLCESAEEYIIGLSSDQEAPSQENILLAARLRSEYTANSRLAAVMGKPLDWMYGKEEAEFYARHVLELDKLSALYEGKEHTFGYIVSDLRKRNSDLSFTDEGKILTFRCWRNVMDTTDKGNPCLKREYYTQSITPFDSLSFVRKLREIAPEANI